ncbi:OmpA family protein [Pseudoduganella lutea]|nr:OmpA family protein [Pseudoduganella lutea]
MSLRTSALLSLSIAAVLSFPLAQAHGAPASKATTAVASTFNPDSVPVSTRPLPAFPYLDWPEKLQERERRGKTEDFDRAWFVAGNARHAAEGRVSRRSYYLSHAGLSQLAAVRNYEQALKELGAVRIDTVKPYSKDFPAEDAPERNRFIQKEFGIYGKSADYSTWLLRTPEKRIWFGLTVTSQQVRLTTLEEKPMERSIALTKADEMKAALDKQGFIALYINFDTDKAALRDDGKPAVDEIARLLKNNPGLKIAVEGHTDNSGDAKRNKALSEQRAATIVTALKGAGIEAARLKSAGFGADKPIADNRTEDGRARNRRVELVKL